MVAWASSTKLPSCGTLPSAAPVVCSLLSAILFLVDSLNPTLWSLESISQDMHSSGWGVQGCSTDCSYRSSSVLLPQTSFAAFQSPDAPKVPLCPHLPPCHEWALLSWEPLFSFRSPSGVPVPFHFHFSPRFPSFLCPICRKFSYVLHAGIFLVLLGVWGPPLVFSRCSVTAVLMYSWYTCEEMLTSYPHIPPCFRSSSLSFYI